MSDTLNYILGTVFIGIGIFMIVQWIRYRKKIIIQDQQWGYLRIAFLVLGLATFMSLMTGVYNGVPISGSELYRIMSILIAVTAFLSYHDGIGEEGMVSAGRFTPWSKVRSYDFEKKEKTTAVYFLVESDNDSKPDEYKTKELDFAAKDHASLMRFLEINLGRKYTRMKKRTKK